MPLLLGVALVVAACSDDEDADAPDDGSRPSIETTEPIIVEVTPPLELSASADPEFLADVLADEVVTADEVEEAYGHYIDCLADGGAAGIYAFDLALRVAYSDWSLPEAQSDANDQAELSATCSRDFLGDLIVRYNEANPPEPDLAESQRASLVACIEAIDPDVAARVPDVVTLDTTGEGAYVGDLQLDVAEALRADAGQAPAVERCVGSLGVPWTRFG